MKPFCVYHITPLNDLEPHLEESVLMDDYLMVDGEARRGVSCKCKCGPAVRYEGNGILVIHNSFDGREGVELANELLNSLK